MRNPKKVKYHPHYDLTSKELADITGASPRTALNWCNGTPMHDAYRRLLELHIDKRVLPDGSRMAIYGDLIYIDGHGGEYVTFDEMRQWWLRRQEMDHLKRDNRLLLKANEILRSEAQKTASQDNQTPSQAVIDNPLAIPDAANEAI